MSAWDRKRENESERRQARRAKRKSKIALGWDVVPTGVLGLFVQLLVSDGRAILLGVTGDGSSLSVAVYEDGDKEKYYIRSDKDVVESLADVIEEYNERAADGFLDFATPQKQDPTPISTKSGEKPDKTE